MSLRKLFLLLLAFLLSSSVDLFKSPSSSERRLATFLRKFHSTLPHSSKNRSQKRLIVQWRITFDDVTVSFPSCLQLTSSSGVSIAPVVALCCYPLSLSLSFRLPSCPQLSFLRLRRALSQLFHLASVGMSAFLPTPPLGVPALPLWLKGVDQGLLHPTPTEGFEGRLITLFTLSSM